MNFFTLPIPLKIEPLYLDQLIAATEYKTPIKQVIRALKYDSVKDIGQFLALILFNNVNLPEADFITGVPLHFKRFRVRGFNQSEEVARKLSQLTNIPYRGFLQRTRAAPPQASLLSKQKRLTNLQNSFQMRRLQTNIDWPQVLTGKTVLLIDDVATTGTTLNECAKILKTHGAGKVIGVVIAHGN